MFKAHSNPTLRTPRYYGQFSLSLGKAFTFYLNSTPPLNTDNRQLFLAQLTDILRKPIPLIWTLHYQLSVVIDFSFFKVKKNFS